MGLFFRVGQTVVDPGHEDAIADGEQGGTDEHAEDAIGGHAAEGPSSTTGMGASTPRPSSSGLSTLSAMPATTSSTE